MARQATLARFEVSGEILSEDTLALLAPPICKLPGAELNEDDFTAAYDLLVERWQAIRTEVADYDTTELRRRWQLEVLELLGYKPEALRAHTRYSDDRYTIALTHRAGDMPFWLLPYGQDYDAKLEQGRRKRSPHEQFQEYLDLTEDEWGILFNGKSIRLLHDYHKSLTRNYVEADLESIFDALDVDAFRVVWRIFSSTKYIKDVKGSRSIELMRDASRQEGATVGKELRGQVRKAIEVLGNGFLAADSDGRLLEELRKDPTAITAFYQALLRVIYRLLFLLYIEYRPGWVPAENREIWAESYSVVRLRELAEEATVLRANGEDAWEGLKVVAHIIREGNEFFGIHPYGGELFDDAKIWLLRDAALPNADLLQAIRLLTLFERDKQPYRVNFSTLDIEAMGSVYEGLLDVTAYITPDGRFAFTEGTERKTTGTYYTPKELVAELIQSALVPVIIDRLEGKVDIAEREAALLSIKVVDPACGSGAFLVQALDKLTETLAKIRFGDEEPSDLNVREARRDVVRHCIHGVDLNPLAVDLCRFVLWLSVAHPKFPLSYLEPLIKCGNSLVGVPLPSQVATRKSVIDKERQRLLDLGDRRSAMRVTYIGWPDSIPDEAYKPITGDSTNVAAAARASNLEARTTGQLAWDVVESADTPPQLAKHYKQLRHVSDDTIEAIHQAETLYADYLASPDYKAERLAADLWCAAFFWPYQEVQQDVVTTYWLWQIHHESAMLPDELYTTIKDLYTHIRFFHWHIEFPDVFQAGGFDCVLGNPPWEKIKLQEQEFFSSRDAAIAGAPNKAIRLQLIRSLTETNPRLAKEFKTAKHSAEAESKFVRKSGRYPFTAIGDINTYALFAELSRVLLSHTGRAGIICPTGIATDDSTKVFFGDMVTNRSLHSYYGFKNERFLFPKPVEHTVTFGLLTMLGTGLFSERMEFCWLAYTVNEMHDPARRIVLTSEDFALVNPNTNTSPVFRTRLDADLTMHIYRHTPVLLNESTGCNPWQVGFLAMFHMANDSNLFSMQYGEGLTPLYEAKMVHQYDHRFATYAGVEAENLNAGILPQPLADDKSDPSFATLPRYWVPSREVESRLLAKWDRLWLLCYRRIARSTDERTFILAVIPRYGTADPAMVILPKAANPILATCFVANMNGIVYDYVVRQKLGGTDLRNHYLQQFAVLPPAAYSAIDIQFIVPRVFELTYTSWSLKPFADDVWLDADDMLKAGIMHQWEANCEMTGNGNKTETPSTGVPFPPFIWNEDRRILIQAELNAYMARLYGLTRKQLRYILDPHGLSASEMDDILIPGEDPTCDGIDLLPVNPAESYPSETFRVLKEREERQIGYYRTRRLVLEAWARLETTYGPAKPVNYRELLAEEPQQLSDLSSHIAKPEPEEEVSPPDEPQMQLGLESAIPELSTIPPKHSDDGIACGMRVRINGHQGLIVAVESAGFDHRKVTVHLFGEKKPRAFLVPPAVMELE